MVHQFTAIVERDGHMYVAYCAGLGLKAIGQTISQAREKLAQAIEVFVATASPEEIKRRDEFYITQIAISDPRAPASYAQEPAYLFDSRHEVTNFDQSLLAAYLPHPVC